MIYRHLAIVIACIVVLSMTVVPGHAAEKEELVVWMWTAHVTDLYQSWYEKITKWFEEENPGATVRFEFIDGAGGEKLIAAVASGNPPDVSLASASRALGFYEAGMFTDLNKYIESTPHMALENFLPTSIQTAQKDGTVFGLPWSWEAKSIYYNTQHLDAAGLDSSHGSIATWKDLEDYSKLLVRKDGSGTITRSGFVNETGTINFISWLYTNGGQFYNEDGTGVVFNNPKGVEALEFMYRLANEFEVTRRGATTSDMMTDNASIIFRNTSSIPSFEQNVPGYTDWLSMAPVPQGPQGVGVGGASWSNMFVIPTGAKKTDLGWKFIQLWLSPRVSVERFLQWGGKNVNSARLDVLQSDVFIDAMESYKHMAVAPEIFNSAGPYPNIRYTEINSAIASLILQASRDGVLAPSAALEEAERISNSILNQR